MHSILRKSTIKSFLLSASFFVIPLAAVAVVAIWSWQSLFPGLTVKEAVNDLGAVFENAWNVRNVPTAEELKKMAEEAMAQDKPASWSEAGYLLAGCLLDKAKGKAHGLPYDLACDFILGRHGVRVERIPVSRRESLAPKLG